jgi:2-oxoglutarate ferredoxin oxidoreductase subunit beta
MPFGNFEPSFNLPFVADACGATYVARWTVYHVRQLAKAMEEGLLRKGLRFIEVLCPCPTLYSRRNKLGDGADQVKYYKEKSTIKHDADTKEVGLTFQGEIVVGKFVDRERPTWLDSMNKHFGAVLGDSFVPYGTNGGGDGQN